MNPIQSTGGKTSARARAHHTKPELARKTDGSLSGNRASRSPSALASLRGGNAFSKLVLFSMAGICGLLLASTSRAADASASQTSNALVLPQKPAWLTDLSLGVKESYDDNVYLSGVGQHLAAGKIVPDGGILARQDHSSFVTTVSPKVGINFAPLLGDQKVLQALTFAYAPDFVTYHSADTESYNAHRLSATVKGQVDDFSFSLENGLNYIDGSKYGASYPSGLSAYGTGILRERREQYQDRNNLTLKYDQEKWFVRPTASLLNYNLNLRQLPTSPTYAGYQNYSDRYDVNGGADLGYKLATNLAVTLGYRDGAQYQQKFSFDATHQSSSSDYQRGLLGLEGKPVSWLDVKLQGGPDFRHYGDAAPVGNYNPTTYYGEAVVTATLSKQDTVSVNYRQWQWVSSTGKVPYLDSTYDLNYKHKFNDKLSANVEGRLLGSDYQSGLAVTGGTPGHYVGTSNHRNDLYYTVSAGLQYSFNANFSANLAYSYDLARNAQDGLTAANVAPREFDHQLISLGVSFKY
jgi:hypothetical protein